MGSLISLIWIVIVISPIVILVISLIEYSKRPTEGGGAKLSLKLSPYNYQRREYIMTLPESKLFSRLESISAGRYYVFPQVHLSSLLRHEVKNGQSWRGALSKIQRKSVDFVLVDRQTLKTAYAIELDDRTHDTSIARRERDDFVNEIFLDAGVPLVRLRNINGMSDEALIERFKQAKLQIDDLENSN